MAIWNPTDLQSEIRQAIHDQLATQGNNALHPAMDNQELGEREEAARAYADENPRHFVEYVSECVRTSHDAVFHIRELQQECWNVYQEEEPPQYQLKEDWQSRVVVPKPHSAVQFAVAQVRKAFTPEFLAVKNETRPAVANFWLKLMKVLLDPSHANFIIRYLDATEMSFAIGQSLEMVPYWVPGVGLQYALIEPWKIHRDPDATPRDPQSGMYWVHEEFQDLYVLREGQKTGQYINVDRVQEDSHNPENPEMDPEIEAERKRHFWVRNKFRTMILTREFYGTVLDSRGDMLLPSANYVVAGQTVIAPPEAVRFPSLRWPGISFSPLPHLLRHDGRSLLQGIRTLWYFMCSLLTLHNDNLNWIVNPMTEITHSALIDQDDIDVFPGKTYLTRETMNGQQAIRTVDRRFISGDVLPNLQYGDSLFQTGTFVNATVQGLPGYRSEITAREQAQHLDQSLTIFAKMGINLEFGALRAIQAGMETVMVNATVSDLLHWLPPEDLLSVGLDPRNTDPTVAPLPELLGQFSVSGLSAFVESMEVVNKIESMIVPMAHSPVFGPYMRPYQIAKSIETRLGLQDEDLLVTEDEAKQIVAHQQQAVAQAQQMQQQLAQAQAALEQQKLQLEAQKLALEAQKIALEGENQARQAMIDAAQLEQERQNLMQEQALAAAELAKLGAEIQRVEAEIGRVIVQTGQVVAQIDLERQKAETAAKEGQQKIALARQQAKTQAAQGDRRA
jgi:hypothetical protein